MGFGLLFIGYATLLFFKVMPPVMLLGAYLMYRGLAKLSAYGKSFKKAAATAAAFGIYHALYTVLWVFTAAGIFDRLFTLGIFVLCDDIVYYGLLLVFHIYLYAGILDISKECGYDKGIKRVYLSRVFMAMFYAVALINLPLNYLGITSYIPLAHFICQIVWIIYNVIFVYGCYMRIATAEIIEEEERKIAEYDKKYGYKINIKRKRK